MGNIFEDLIGNHVEMFEEEVKTNVDHMINELTGGNDNDSDEDTDDN